MGKKRMEMMNRGYAKEGVIVNILESAGSSIENLTGALLQDLQRFPLYTTARATKNFNAYAI